MSAACRSTSSQNHLKPMRPALKLSQTENIYEDMSL